MNETRKIYTLTELGKSIRSVIERNYATSYWLKAEIARLNFYPRSGHCYPELVDKTGNVVQAQMRSTIWAADYKLINTRFLAETGETLKEGMAILFKATVGFHPVYGLTLQIWEVEPSFTMGEMAREKARNIDKLQKQGVFDANKAHPMPLLPARLAVISVETSKGYHDFLNILHQHAKHYAWWHFLFPSVLQGDKAAEGIISQLRIIKKAKERFDVVAIIRGGGGDIGLSCYDDYQLAHEIATFPIPVITGIGHATNVTISEMVAWANKITPTDVAYFVVDKFKSFGKRIEDASTIISSRAVSLMAFNKQTLDHFTNRIVRQPTHVLATQKGKLDALSNKVISIVRKVQQGQKDQLSEKAAKLSMHTPRMVIGQRCELENKRLRINSLVEKQFIQATNQLDQLEIKTHLLDPHQVLKRGYSITQYKQITLHSFAALKPGDILSTRFFDGEIQSKVIPEDK